MGLHGKRGRPGSWRRLVGMAAPAGPPPERRIIHVAAGQEYDPVEFGRLEAAGFRLVHMAQFGWFGADAGCNYFFERPPIRTPPLPIRRRKK
jgi:hypothetical protein